MEQMMKQTLELDFRNRLMKNTLEINQLNRLQNYTLHKQIDVTDFRTKANI